MISEREAAKYPFLKDAITLVDTLNLNVEDLIDPGYKKILDRAENRVTQAIIKGKASVELVETLVELLSFPVANMYVTAIGEEFLFRRYALAEAIRAQELMLEESDARLAKIARLEFGWDMKLIEELMNGIYYKFELHFKDYLRNAAAFREPKWKLVNRMMRNGYVIITKPEASRLLQEEIYSQIFEQVSKRRHLELPESIKARVNSIHKTLEENRSRLTGGELPSDLILDGLPPCIKNAYEGLKTGKRLSHMERFALTSFLINAGMKIEDIVELFVSITDFDEDFTRYQIEHIAGLRGGRTRYTPPTCSTLRTHGVCYNPDRLCEYVNHPLNYYRIKIRDKNTE